MVNGMKITALVYRKPTLIKYVRNLRTSNLSNSFHCLLKVLGIHLVN